MQQAITKTDEILLSELNAQFIKNFISQDVVAHDKILHKDFICIENNGVIVDRKEYLSEWAHAYENSGCTAFSYASEYIRIFGNVALVRSVSSYAKIKEGKKFGGESVYTDTYLKENGSWMCVQAQMTPVIK